MGPEQFLTADRISRIRQAVRGILSDHRTSVLTRIGNTPLVRLDRLNPGSKVKIYAKVEGFNPSGSCKDRIALYMLADAVSSGKLTSEVSILEATSGNTGIALSMVASRLRLRVVVTVPDNVTVERHKIISAYGARPLLTPGEKGTDGAIERAKELLDENRDGLIWTAQHYNEVNSFAHYETTGNEIIHQLRDAGENKLDAFVAASGTTGTLMGISAKVKEAFPKAKAVAVWPGDKIMGIRKPEGPRRPGIYHEALIDRVIEVFNAEAMAMLGDVATEEGMLLGPSGGAALVGALRVAKDLEEQQGEGVVVCMLPDFGERYLSLAEFKPTYREKRVEVPGIPLRRKTDAAREN